MLKGYKTYIGIGIWTIGALLSEWFGMPEIGANLIGLGKLVAAGGFVAKMNRIAKGGI